MTDVRPVCMFCQTRFSLAPGTAPTRCESWRSINGEHVERRVATPEQRARMRLEAPPLDLDPEPIFDTSTLMDPDDEPVGTNWRQRARKPTNAMREKAKPASPQPGLF